MSAFARVGVPYSPEMIESAAADAFGQANPDSVQSSGVIERYGEETNVRVFDTDPDRLTEMDAVVAYLQVLGTLIDVTEMAAAGAGED
jgi:cytochrome c oxidase cbb3-type subunit 2